MKDSDEGHSTSLVDIITASVYGELSRKKYDKIKNRGIYSNVPIEP